MWAGPDQVRASCRQWTDDSPEESGDSAASTCDDMVAWMDGHAAASLSLGWPTGRSSCSRRSRSTCSGPSGTCPCCRMTPFTAMGPALLGGWFLSLVTGSVLLAFLLQPFGPGHTPAESHLVVRRAVWLRSEPVPPMSCNGASRPPPRPDESAHVGQRPTVAAWRFSHQPVDGAGQLGVGQRLELLNNGEVVVGPAALERSRSSQRGRCSLRATRASRVCRSTGPTGCRPQDSQCAAPEQCDEPCGATVLSGSPKGNGAYRGARAGIGAPRASRRRPKARKTSSAPHTIIGNTARIASSDQPSERVPSRSWATGR